MQRYLLGVIGAVAFSGAAVAADLPSRRAPPVYVPPPAPVFTWTGFYLGLNAGYAFNSYQDASLTANDPAAQVGLNVGAVTPFFRSRASGFAGGGQIGYNYELGGGGAFPVLGALGSQGGGVVVGLEADVAYTDLNRSSVFVGQGAFVTPFGARTEYVGTARGRIGYAFDRLLIYGTGGFAYGGVKSSASIINAAGVTGFTGTTDSIRTGYAYGGGIEYALPTTSFVNFFQASAVTVKVEYVHYDLGSSTTAILGVPGVATGSSFNDRVHTQGDIVRAGINYKFSTTPAPVVARY